MMSDNPSIIAHEFLLQVAANRLIEVKNIIRRNLHHLPVDVIAINLVLKLTLLTIIIVDTIEEICIKVLPLLKRIFLAEHTRIDILGNQGSLDKDSARTTERINQVAFAIPARQENQASRQHLIDRSRHSGSLVAALVEAFARRVERNRHHILCYVHIEAEVRVADTHIGAVTRLFAPIVRYSVFHTVCHKLRVAEVIAEDNRVHKNRVLHVHILRPVYLLHYLIHLIGISCLKLLDGLEHLDGCASAEVCLIEHLLVASE